MTKPPRRRRTPSVVPDAGHHHQIEPREEVAASLIELLAEIERQETNYAARGMESPEWIGRCIGLIRHCLETLTPEIPWPEAAAMAAHLSREPRS